MEPLSFFSQFIIGPILCHSQAKPSQAHYSENAQYSRFLPMIYILWMCQSIHLMNVIISVMCSCSRPTNHHHHHSSSKTHYLCPAIEDIIYTWERERAKENEKSESTQPENAVFLFDKMLVGRKRYGCAATICVGCAFPSSTLYL